MTTRRLLVALSLSVAAAATVYAAPIAQRAVRAVRPDAAQERWPDNTKYDGNFKFARIWYDAQTGFAFGGGEPPWHHDYPYAELHLSALLNEVSFVRAFRDGGNVYRLGDPELLQYPIALMSEPGFWVPSDEEVESLRAYIEKGGFLIFDDFAGPRDMMNLQRQMMRAVPGLMPVELTREHGVFQSFFQTESLEMMHPYRNVPSSFFGFFEDNDPTKRMIGIANYNNDLGELWEFSAQGFYPVDLTNEAYKFGVNYVVYALTH